MKDPLLSLPPDDKLFLSKRHMWLLFKKQKQNTTKYSQGQLSKKEIA